MGDFIIEKITNTTKTLYKKQSKYCPLTMQMAYTMWYAYREMKSISPPILPSAHQLQRIKHRNKVRCGKDIKFVLDLEQKQKNTVYQE